MRLYPDPEPFTDADGYAVADEILEYFESYKIATLAPIASIIRRERDFAKPKWRDIATAPRNGSQFLALVSNGWMLIASSPHRMKRGAYYTWWVGGDLRNFPIVDTFPEGYDFSRSELLVKWMPLPDVES